jgi:hypothetical protein
MITIGLEEACLRGNGPLPQNPSPSISHLILLLMTVFLTDGGSRPDGFFPAEGFSHESSPTQTARL